MIVRFLSILCFGVLVASAHSVEGNNDNEDIPYLELAEPDEGYHGLIRENETLVEVTPAIRARGPLCSFLILNNKHHGEAPFEIMVIDENEARLRVRYPLNCEKRRNYKFDIAAVGCDGSYSNTVPVHITVTDVNEFAPVFSQAAYVRSVDEGKIYDEIVRVDATDRDCTPRYGDVCKYEILNDGDRSQPFAIDNEGVIRNTEPLEYDKSHNHILSVVAYDCGMLQSAPVMVTIKVNKPCRAGWKGLAERVDYAPGTGPLALFPAARLEACSSDERCPGVTRIQAAVTLQASRAGVACDRDTYTIHAQRTICGLDQKTIDLLPSPGAGNEWAKSLKPDSGRDGEQMFEFDGESTSAVIPESILKHSIGSTFALSTWLRHAPPPDHDKHRKEHVLCLADDHKMNRHHYALFVRNCRLILLLRRDFGEGDLNIFRPAEWRWKLPEVCDNEWHHYAVNVRFPNVELFVDGEPYRAPDGKGPEVIDDWPLHPAHGVNTTLVIGACWQGTESDMKHHMHGWMAGLGILLGAVHSPSELRCAARCREGLSLAPDLYLKSVSVEGDGAAEVETLVRRVAYGDARSFPTPGRRNVHLATTITCDNGRVIKARPAESYVMVLAPQTPTILLNGSADAARDYAHFRAGLPVFPDLRVQVLARSGDNVKAETQKLDSCVVSVYPALNPDHEALALRGAASLPESDIRATLTRDGVSLTGTDTVHNYQKVLREIEYSNKKPAYYLNRVFKLTCSELNGRFTSNEYVQTLTVVHPRAAGDVHAQRPSGLADKLDVARDKSQASNNVEVPLAMNVPRAFAAHAQHSPHAAEVPSARILDLHSNKERTSNNVAVLIGAVCVGAVVSLAALGAARARARPRAAPRAHRVPPHDSEMAWDDSALTITVNPMDETATEVGRAAAPRAAPADSSDGESCSDSDSEHNDSSDDDEEVMAGKQHKYRNISQLEWDNSTM
ncbi:calsyntenin-1 isoform X2 [Maniola jurtina]|uniref:calsyntenin-1 isoform X2 n=1 Tax=Maniola jurtina TaxID=191418 RepID=UPI001E68758F|nr:calsyntenin-1 isoform X2 [Maniola jurtina]